MANVSFDEQGSLTGLFPPAPISWAIVSYGRLFAGFSCKGFVAIGLWSIIWSHRCPGLSLSQRNQSRFSPEREEGVLNVGIQF